MLEDLAAALGCSVVDLTGQPYLPPDRTSATTLGNEAPRWATAVAVPTCRYELWPRTPGRNPRHGVAWLGDPLSGSWASVIPAETDDRYEVRQRGPRRLWDEVEAAYRWWRDQGKPTLDQWRFTVSPDGYDGDNR